MATTQVFGHPVHIAVRVRNWRNQHGTPFADVAARCGHTERSGQLGATRPLGTYRPGVGSECPECWATGWHNVRTEIADE